MNWKRSSFLLFAALLLILSAQVHATTMLKMDLGDLTNRADKIFRGTVLSVQQNTVQVGGGELPAVTYRFRVDELFKGQATQVKGEKAIIELNLLGSLVDPKADENNVLRFSQFRDVPQFNEGGDYLLFTTAESSVGLSVTVGLGQGAFKVLPIDGDRENFQAVNQFNNAGLGLGESGPVHLNVLSARIRTLLGQ